MRFLKYLKGKLVKRYINEEYFNNRNDDEIASDFIWIDTFDWYYHAINELGEKGGPLKIITKSNNEFKFEFDIGSIPKCYIFHGRVSTDLLHIMFYPKNDNSLNRLNNLTRTESFSLIGHLSQCIFDCFRYNKSIKRLYFIANNKELEHFHDTMISWIPKKYKEIKFIKKEHGNKPSYWYEKIPLTKEDFKYTINW